MPGTPVAHRPPPEVRNPDIAYFEICGDGEVDRTFGTLRTIATRAGPIAASINKFPTNRLRNRREDALIAYTFDQYQDRRTHLAAALPDGQVHRRGMDAVQALARKEFNQNIERFGRLRRFQARLDHLAERRR